MIILYTSIFAVLILQTFTFAIAHKIKRMDIADITWGLGILLVTIIAYTSHESLELKIITLLTSIWGLRLAFHIGKRTLKKKLDRRYQALSAHWKNKTLRTYLQVFLLQGLLMIPIGASPLTLALITPLTQGEKDFLPIFLITGVIIWGIGFSFEAIGDQQLKHFKQNPKNQGKIITTGLWKYTRHPNYFGEVTLWWGIWIISLSALWQQPNFLVLTIISFITPFTITLLITKISGIPMAENHYTDRADWQDYKKHTSVFFPWFSKKM